MLIALTLASLSFELVSDVVEQLIEPGGPIGLRGDSRPPVGRIHGHVG